MNRPVIGMLLLFSAPTGSAEVIWRGDFETGDTKQWRGAPKAGAVTVVTEPVHEGKYAARIDATDAAGTPFGWRYLSVRCRRGRDLIDPSGRP